MGLGARLAASLYALTVLAALLAALLLMQQSTGSEGWVDVEAVKQKYSGSLVVSAMWGSMYKYVTEDESIGKVERWITAGRTQEGYEAEVQAVMEEDCTNCHSRTSTMTDAVPGMPLTSYEDVLALSTRGLPDGKLLGSLHTHLFAIGTVMLALSVLLSISDLKRVWIVLLIIVGFTGLWLDTGGWVLGRSSEVAVWLIIAGGAMASGALAAMSLAVVFDCWIRVPLLSRSD